MQDNKIVQNTDEEFDVLVIGSGITGGWAAKEFCEAGLKVLLIERGRLVEHRKDYPTEGKGPWEYPYRTRTDNLLTERDHAIQQQCYAFNDTTKHFFGNDRELPYTTEEGTEFSWIRANQLGGKSLLWARQTFRLSDYDLSANAKDGHGIDWPIRYKDLQPWYDYVERFAGIAAGQDNLPQLPDSIGQPAFELTKPELDFQAAMARHFPDRPVVTGRCAHLTQPSNIQLELGRVTCQARHECYRGCSFGAYFSTQSATLPAAARTGNLHIAPNSVVHSLNYDEAKKRVSGVRVIDNDDLSEREYRGKLVFLCASTLGSTQILLNSVSKTFPDGLANSSGVLGRYLMDHNYNAWASAIIPGYEEEYYKGRRPTGIYIPNTHFEPSRYHKKFIRGYGLAGSASRGNWQGMSSSDGFGADFKQRMTQAGPWRIWMGAQGEMLPRADNQVSLHPTRKDKWGIPQLHFNCKWSENELTMMEHARDTAIDMLQKAGFEDIQARATQAPPGLAIHEVGTARMGDDPKQSVLNKYNQAHDVANLFVTDGSSFCSSGVVNPSLTFMALTVRAAHYAVEQLKAGRL
ncbi:GMC oxidoreductase [Lacimicrobium alkaliphilum]|uniref:GMC family oxidoreductase n=1 Tax=Lacimicrobium alkaliphilum TaxID=1526571 RepID=A0A0U3AVC5_9ALTE|nr:GMC family oxidoreductase [Lacimicrobium alkaliphilum]ALS96848.1 GMC family oxidoreductase [Lacimicrobium alkaliphilum]